MTVALLFPGQGAQRAGMLHRLPDSETATTVLRESQTVCAELGLPPDLDSAEVLTGTVATQVALVVAGVACARSLMVDHGVTPAHVAGHSAGAFSAAVVAGVLTLREALAAVHLRGEAMRAACAGRAWGMAAVTGLPTQAAAQLAQQVATPADPLWVANINSATETVLGGTAKAVAAAEGSARQAGAVERLDMTVASHGPVQTETAQALHAHFAEVARRRPTCRYLTNAGGRSVGTAEAVLADLADSVARTVRWYDGMRLITELGVDCTVETAPGHVLTRLMRAIAPDVVALSIDDDGMAVAARRAVRSAGAPPRGDR